MPEKKLIQSVKLADLEQMVSELKQKVAKAEESKAWYRNYPFILSLCAFIFTASLSVYTLISSGKEKSQSSHSATIGNIISQIDNIKNYEKDYYQQQSSIAIDNNTKAMLRGIYFSKLNQVSDEISKKMSSKVYNDLESSVLNDYARFVQLIGKTAEAIKINTIALKKCREDYTKVTIMRTLGNLYSIPGRTQNLTKSRGYRRGALKITKSYSGEYSTINTMESFIYWANDEYLNFSNKEFANSLLDSATFYAEKLQEYNPQKYEAIKQIRAAYNYYNDILNINFGAGSWIIYKNNQRIGVANISLVNNFYNVSIDIRQGSKLQKEVMGTGNFVSERKIRFVGTSSYLDKVNTFKLVKSPLTNQFNQEVVSQYFPQQRTITLELEVQKNKHIKATYYELEKSAEKWDLRFVRNF